ncbi:hypothetical protein CVT26_006809 [Gymnopilus dilepis]|uniref:Uncharacterized protein n=1 Tax=Gymnopilus dilepis TaxID=231916 RepID=A0A409Y312_9AGAR|nr:hypothetical protein CVT26_006809 [Gymnopilus dilepis]
MADNDLELHTFSLEQFCNFCYRLLDAERFSDFVRFSLTGICDGFQATIEAHQNSMRGENIPLLRVTRDYDSILGISEHILSKKNVTINILPNFSESLSKNVHINYTFRNDKGRFTAPIHTIPNICIGKFGVRTSIRILFIGLYSKDRQSHYLSKEECNEFYEKGLLPTLIHFLGNRAGDLPATLELERFRAQNRSGHLAFGTRMLPDYAVDDFGNFLREALGSRGVEWAENLVFLHEIRGVKNATFHTPNEIAADTALSEFLEEYGISDYDVLSNANWYIDVGIEVASEDRSCLAWRTDAHNLIVRELGRLSPSRADSITKPGSSQYYRDLTSHMTEVSGFRMSPGSRSRGEFDIQYMQAYTTDKALTYRPDGPYTGKYITVKQILDRKAETYLDNLYKLYLTSAKTNFSCARLEVRVPLSYATRALNGFLNMRFERYLFSFPRRAWWGFRAYRALAFKYVLEWQFSGIRGSMKHRSALLLTAAAPWFLNSLHSTPDTGPSSRELMNAILPHISINEVSPDHLPYRITLPEPTQHDLQEEPSEEVEEDDQLARQSLERDVDLTEEENFPSQLEREEDVDVPMEQRNDEALSDEDMVEVSQMMRFTGTQENESDLELGSVASHPSAEGHQPRQPRASPQSRREISPRVLGEGYGSDVPMRGPSISDSEEEPIPPPRRAAQRSPSLEQNDNMDSEEENDAENRAHLQRRIRMAQDTVPHIPYGAIFLREICVGDKHPVPRFRDGPWITKKAVTYLFGCSLDEASDRIDPPLISRPRDKNRTRNKVIQRHRSLEHIPSVFQLEKKGLSLVQRRDQGSDLEDSSDEESEEDIPRTLDKRLDRILACFWIDILKLSPNRKNASDSAYLLLGPAERSKARQDIFQTRNLALLFEDCFWRVVKKTEWKRNFDLLWPDKGDVLNGNVQNYGKSAYYREWRDFVSAEPQESVDEAKTTLWNIFQDIYWLPQASRERIWDSRIRKAGKSKKSSGLPVTQPAPLLLVYKREPEWIPQEEI